MSATSNPKETSSASRTTLDHHPDDLELLGQDKRTRLIDQLVVGFQSMFAEVKQLQLKTSKLEERLDTLGTKVRGRCS